MSMRTTFFLLLSSFLATVPTALASCIHGTTLFPRDAGNGTVKVSNFGYTGLQGPLNWAALDPSYTTCATSNSQSPITLNSATLLVMEALQIDFAAAQKYDFENLGSTVEVILNGTTTRAGKQWNLKQFHFHAPSEHRINEEFFPMEMHLVHDDGSGKILVLAALFEVTADGTSTDFLKTLASSITAIATPGTVTEIGALNLQPLRQHLDHNSRYQYMGSLTTPPCTDDVMFIIIQKPLPIDVPTFLAFKSVMKFNSRYSQNTPGQTNLLQVAAQNAGVMPCSGSPPQQPPAAAASGPSSSSSTTATTTTTSSTSTSPPSVAGGLADQDECSGTSKISCHYISG